MQVFGKCWADVIDLLASVSSTPAQRFVFAVILFAELTLTTNIDGPKQ